MGEKTIQCGNLIGGKWEQRGATGITRRNPANVRDVVATAPDSSAEDARRAIEAAAEAFQRWRRMIPPERGKIVLRAAQLLESRLEEVAQLLTREEGKIVSDSRGEVKRGIDIMEYAAGMWGPEAIHDGLIFELYAKRNGQAIPYKVRTCAIVPEDGSRPIVDLTFTNLFLAMHAVGVRRGLRYYNDHVPYGTCVGAVDGMALVAVEECRHAYQLHTRLHMESVADDAYCTTPLPRDHPCETELNGIVARAIIDMKIACYGRGSCEKG